ncbi:hypothetical protein [Amycolatopsis sp. FDAARGOS 1241]|uniref:hypothetical protein n=1 Tax=Amycolatopsis sp. FDAARGOS 1241 TaxID=2778070 RepID=UPI001951369A|nr:hypothetical protein [Amycolatopsis sp. FDAARGOS 1241]QRP47885.1 hypothetical protein I6J71_08220 [Amycolatopsis sp. FDAARGOS 1241]
MIMTECWTLRPLPEYEPPARGRPDPAAVRFPLAPIDEAERLAEMPDQGRPGPSAED